MAKLRPFLAGFMTAFLLCGAAAADDHVDVALVLAVDVSGSVTDDRFRLQMQGYAAALAAPEVLDAIRSGPQKAIAVTLVQWAGPSQQAQVLEWARIEDEASARRFAGAAAEAPRRFGGVTAIAGAIDYCARLLQRSEFAEARRVIDISGDGSSNGGPPPEPARDAAAALGITVNGLPILTEEPDLEAYYRTHVIGGPGAFTLAVDDMASFSGAVLRKLVTEIAASDGRPGAPPGM